MVNDRQQVADDLARLTQQMRDTARELAPTQPAASGKLRSALDGIDENDLNTRMQRSSDGLRSGTFSDPGRNRPHQRFAKAGSRRERRSPRLGQRPAHFRRRRAQPCHGRSIPSARPTRRPRRTSRPNQAGNRVSRSGQPGGQQFQTGQLARNGQSGQAGQPGQQQAQNGQPGQQAGQAGRTTGGSASATASPVQLAIPAVARAIARATSMATMTPATLASPAAPWRPSKVPTRPIRSARLTRD